MQSMNSVARITGRLTCAGIHIDKTAQGTEKQADKKQIDRQTDRETKTVCPQAWDRAT